MVGFFTGSDREQRTEELRKALSLARQDVEISDQQVRLARDRLRIVGFELDIANLQRAQAGETLDFLVNQFTNAELYDWMSLVLEDVYANFLRQATAVAQLAANQLAFERQEPIPQFIQADYWEAAMGLEASPSGEGAPADRRGLTGSARLLQDIFQLDQYAFETEQRKLQLTKTLSLARMAPFEFQRFRDTGVLNFATLQEMFDRDFPGHFLRLIKRVRVSVIALIPPTEGIKATLSTSGISRVITRGDFFREQLIRRQPEAVSFTTPINATGQFELQLLQENELLLPFEASGVDTDWTFELPKAANQFDFRTIADVTLGIDYTALESRELRPEVVERLGNVFASDRAFSFRHELADQWFDLNNPDQTETPMTVRFTTRRADFPPNIDELRIRHVALLFSLRDGLSFEMEVVPLLLEAEGAADTVGGSATSIDSVISTRLGSAPNWGPMIGRSPIGRWELGFADTEPNRRRFSEEEIENMLLVISYSAVTPDWPV